MELRPCIDIHNGKVKQLVGGSIQDQGDSAQENYISSQDAAWYARLFQEKGLKNGHVILLNSKDSAYYEQTHCPLQYYGTSVFPLSSDEHIQNPILSAGCRI